MAPSPDPSPEEEGRITNGLKGQESISPGHALGFMYGKETTP